MVFCEKGLLNIVAESTPNDIPNHNKEVNDSYGARLAQTRQIAYSVADAHPYLDYSIQLVKLGNWCCGLRLTIRIIHHKPQHVYITHGQSRLGREEKSVSVFETEKERALNIYFMCARSPSKVKS